MRPSRGLEPVVCCATVSWPQPWCIAGRASFAGLIATTLCLHGHQLLAEESDARIAALFDRPGHVVKAPASGPEGLKGEIRCFSYQTFTVKELDYGEHGDQAISVTPVTGTHPPPCGKQDDPGEKLLPNTRGGYFVGAKGSFLVAASTSTANNIGPFWVYDAARGSVVYKDDGDIDETKSIAVENGTLTLTYPRGVSGSCSLLTGGQACWSTIVRETNLPHVIAALPPPVAACRESYALAGKAGGTQVDPGDPSVITYDVTVQIDRSGKAAIIRRGALGCGPAE